MDLHVCFALWRLQAGVEVGSRKQEKLEQERAAAVRLSEQRTAQLQEMVIQAQQQCLESIRASEAAAAKANARADAAESRLEEVERQMAEMAETAKNEVAQSPREASPALPKESQPFAPTLPNLQFQEDDEQNIPEKPPKIIIEPPKITIEITQPPLEKAEEGSAARSPTAPRSPGPTSPTSPNHGVLTPGVVERHILSEPAIVSLANSTGSASKFPQVSAEEDGTKRSVKTLFVQCFKDDLFQERQLLMSQINNLFKLRNNGEALQYKEAGYEKLHNFLADVPGLSLIGAGNRMELKLGDRDAFERFSDDLLEGREDLPTFDQPKPVPESFQNKVVEVFRRCGSREIPAKNFRDLWNCFFPHEKLQCKDYGYRDVKGLLANIPVVEKVGGKNSTKYVLKVNDTEFAQPEPESKAVVEDDFVEVGTTPMAPMTPSMPMERGGQPQRLELRNFMTEQIQPAIITPNHRPVNTLDDGAELEASRQLMQPRQVQASQAPGKWGSSSSGMRPEAAWKDYSWAQEMGLSASQASGGQAPDRLPPFRNDLSSQYPSRSMNVPPQFLPQSAPHLQLGNPIQQQLLDLQMAAEGAANRSPDPRFNQPHTEELLRLQQQVQQRLLQEQQRQQLLQHQLEGIPQQSFPPQQFQPPLVQDPGLGLPQYWNQHAPGDVDAAHAGRTGSGDQQSCTGGEEIDQAGAADDSLHLDLLLRASASKALDAPETAAAAAAAVQTRASRLDRPRKSASAFVTSPATLRRDDEELCHASKFDVGSLYQATSFLPSFEGHIESLQNDRNCLLVHFANGRILFSNACCDRLFSVLTPLRHREITEIIAEEDRVNFSSRIMYLSIGKFTVMEKTTFNIITAKGVVPANICGEHLMGSVWWMDCELIEDQEPGDVLPSPAAHGHLPLQG